MKTFFSVLIWILAILLGILGTIGSFLGISFVISNIPVISVIALVVGFLITYGMGKLARLVRGKKSKSYSPIIIAGITMGVVSLFCAFTVFKPLPGPIMTADVPANTKYWELSTGSHVAYWHYGAEGVKKPTPIIFIHGGPGAYTRDLERDFFSKFTKEGYDVYLYDQPGAGFSNKIKLEEYSIHRYVEDIEAIRKKIGADKIILVGQSFGGALGSSYVTTYPNNVEKVIFTAPAPLGKESLENSKETHTAADNIKSYEPSFRENVRLSAAVILSSLNSKKAAENLLPQKEVTDYSTRMIFDAFAQSFPPSYENKVPKIKGGGLNIHSNILLTSDFNKISASVREKVKKVNVPVLILRTEYDYIPWKNTREYRELYPNNKFVYIKDSGHISWAVNEKDTYSVMSAFILNKELPLPNYDGNEDPSKAK